MQYLLLGTTLLLLALAASQSFASASPARLARQIKISVAILAGGAAALLMARGMLAYAIWLAALAAGMFSSRRLPSWLGSGPTAHADADPAASSRVTTAYLDVALDHDSGAVSGHVLKGEFAGRELDDMAPADITRLWATCRFDDPASADILAAYLDRRYADWREAFAAREDHQSDAGRQHSSSGPMSRAEALAILGLPAAATADDIRRAHRVLMLKLHPDRGGSDALAAKVNQAKDALVGKD